MRHDLGRTEGQCDVAMGAGMQVKNGARLCPEVENLPALQDFENDDLVLHQRGNRDGLAAVLTQPHQVLTRHRQHVELFPQLLTRMNSLMPAV